MRGERWVHVPETDAKCERATRLSADDPTGHVPENYYMYVQRREDRTHWQILGLDNRYRHRYPCDVYENGGYNLQSDPDRYRSSFTLYCIMRTASCTNDISPYPRICRKSRHSERKGQTIDQHVHHETVTRRHGGHVARHPFGG